MRRLLRIESVLTVAVMFVVLVMGALVTVTGSGHGCSNTWPLCNGKVIPAFNGTPSAIAALIEFSHRAATALVSLLIFILAGGTLYFYRRRREAQILAPLMIVFLFAQAILGAIAAGVHESPPVLALHFGVSLIAFATIVLTSAFLLEEPRADIVRDRSAALPLRWSIVGLLIFTYIVTYLGAYVVHSGASLACADWPLCARPAASVTSWFVLTQLIHRVAATVLAAGVAGLWLVTWRARATRPDLFHGATAALISVLLQAVAGGFVVLSRLSLLSELLHAALISLLFASLCYMAYHLVPRRACLPARERGAVQAAPARNAVPARAR